MKEVEVEVVVEVVVEIDEENENRWGTGRGRSRSQERREERRRNRSRTGGGKEHPKVVQVLNKIEPDIAVNAVISHTIPRPSITTPEDISTILYPYFHHLGKFSINPEFYKQIIPKINESIQREDDSKFTFDIFERIYEAVHATPKSDIVDDDSDMNLPAVTFSDDTVRTEEKNHVSRTKSYVSYHSTAKVRRKLHMPHSSSVRVKSSVHPSLHKTQRSHRLNLSSSKRHSSTHHRPSYLKTLGIRRKSFAQGTRFGTTRRASPRVLSTVHEVSTGE